MGGEGVGRKWFSPGSQGALECVSLQGSRQACSLPTADSGFCFRTEAGWCRGTLTLSQIWLHGDWTPDPSQAGQRLRPWKWLAGWNLEQTRLNLG